MDDKTAVSKRAQHTHNFPNFKKIWGPKALANVYDEHTNPKVSVNMLLHHLFTMFLLPTPGTH